MPMIRNLLHHKPGLDTLINLVKLCESWDEERWCNICFLTLGQSLVASEKCFKETIIYRKFIVIYKKQGRFIVFNIIYTNQKAQLEKLKTLHYYSTTGNDMDKITWKFVCHLQKCKGMYEEYVLECWKRGDELHSSLLQLSYVDLRPLQ